MRTLQLYGTGSATANAVAQVTVPTSGTLKAIQASLLLDSITDGAIVRVEVIKVPQTQIAVNGALDPFFQLGVLGNFVTSGLAQGGVNDLFRVNIPCRQGEILYLHAVVAGTATYYFNGILWLA